MELAPLSVEDLFDDGFAATARAHARGALARGEAAMTFEGDIERVRSVAKR